jgi:hypothetical protein
MIHGQRQPIAAAGDRDRTEGPRAARGGPRGAPPPPRCAARGAVQQLLQGGRQQLQDEAHGGRLQAVAVQPHDVGVPA